MFPKQRDGAVFADLSNFEEDKFVDDLLVDDAAVDGVQVTDTAVKKRPRETSSSSKIQEDKNNEGASGPKKAVHREIEKQRRKEMASLYASLRSLLPLEYVKGKRAVCDHMYQAANYITDTQKKIEEMKMRRDKLEKLSGTGGRTAIDAGNPDTNISDSPYSVKINRCNDGAEILISSRIDGKSFPLSKVLADLLGRGLNVHSCVSTRGDRCTLHQIEIELDDPTSIDLSELQERLLNVIKLA